MALQTVQDIIEIGDASTYLAGNYNAKGKLFGGRLARSSDVTIAMITDCLRWGYDGGAQTTASLRSTANYLYWLCGMFGLEAQFIISGTGGGTVISINPSTRPNPLDFIVSASSFISTGESSVTIQSFIGYNVDFLRGGIGQNTTDYGDGSSYYTWDKEVGLLTISPSAGENELFRISPIS